MTETAQSFGAAAGSFQELLTEFEGILDAGALARIRKIAALMRDLGGEAKVTNAGRQILAAAQKMDGLPQPTTAEGVQQRGYVLTGILEAVADLVPGHQEDALIALLKSKLADSAWCGEVAELIGPLLATP